MAKSSDNFLRGWCRQVREALDDGTELGYEAAELIEELAELLVPDRDTDPEMGQSDADGGSGAPPSAHSASAGHAEADQPGVSGLGSDVEHLLGSRGIHHESGVPRGTRGGAPVLTGAECKRVYRG